MRKKAVAINQCNSFYVSCERVFDASIAQRPVVVLSNNDGCIVALSKESKKLGLRRGQPAFQFQDILKRHQVQIFSSNYSLYADMSARVMSVLKTFSPSVEVYSIDEAFLDLSHLDDVDLTEYAHTIKARVWQHTGIPVSVGIGPTKCLAKMAIREELEEAVATYTARVAEKLRQQDSLAGALTVFIRTNTFNTNIPQYSNSFTIQLPYPTAFTPELIAHALKGLKAMYRKGFSYKKCGVSLSKITPLDVVQPDLFGEYSINDHTRQGRLMFIVDAMNRIYGRDTLFFGIQGITRSWAMRQMHLSARFTTRWSDILAIESLQTTGNGR